MDKNTKIQSLLVIFPEIKCVPGFGDGSTIHFLKLVGALVDDLDNSVWALPVGHGLLLFAFEEDLPEDKFV